MTLSRVVNSSRINLKIKDEGLISSEKGHLVNYIGKGRRTPLSIVILGQLIFEFCRINQMDY
jgi:hypothetical protein